MNVFHILNDICLLIYTFFWTVSEMSVLLQCFTLNCAEPYSRMALLGFLCVYCGVSFRNTPKCIYFCALLFVS